MEIKNKFDFNTWIVTKFINNTRLAILVFIFLIIAGIYSLNTLNVEGFPSPQINVIVISDVYKGATAEQVESQVTKPIEVAVQGQSGITDVQSTSSNGFASIVLNVDATANLNVILEDVRNKLQSVTVPTDADKIIVNVPQIQGSERIIALTGTNDIGSLRNIGDQLKLKLDGISNVSSVKLLNNISDQIQVKWDAAILAKNNITISKLQGVIQSSNLDIPVGNIKLNGSNTSTIINTSINSIDGIKNLIVGGTPKSPIYIKDIATVNQVLISNDVEQNIGYKGETIGGGPQLSNAVLYEIDPKNNVDALQVDDEESKVIDSFKKSNPNANIITLFNTATNTRNQLNEIIEGSLGGKLGNSPFSFLGYLFGGIWLVMIAMLLFINWRAAIISAVAIPLSFLFTLIALKLEGVNLNTLVLFSLVLVLGLIVDPAIVVLEAIQQEIELGKKGKEAILAAIEKIGNGVFMAALTSIIVFIPFGVVSGVFGKIISYIPITVIPALIASYFIPLLFLTYLGQHLLKPPRKGVSNNQIENLWPFSRWIVNTNKMILRHKFLQIIIFIFAIVLPIVLTGFLFAKGAVKPVQFSSPSDTQGLIISASFPSNISIDSKRQFINNINNYLINETSIKNFFAFNQNDSSAKIIANLLPRNLRDADSPVIVDRLKQELMNLDNPSLREYVEVSEEQTGPPTLDFPVAINIYDDNLSNLKKAAIATGNFLRNQSKVTRVEDGFTNINNNVVQIVPDLKKLQQYGILPVQLSQILSAVLNQTSLTKVDELQNNISRQYDVVLVSTGINNIAQIKNIIILSNHNLIVHLSDVSQISLVEGYTAIQRINGKRFVTVQAQVVDQLKDAQSIQDKVKEFWNTSRLNQYHLQSDALEDKGTGNQFVKSFQDLFIALGVSILITYIVFVLFFRSFIQPFIILFAIPLSFLGVFPSLALVGGQFGFLEILGVITLVGIVENVGIFFIDLANKKRKLGQNYKEAISEASGIRFRPVFLTKLTALGGLLPLAIVSPFWRNLAIVVITGILTSGILSLFTTSILYSWSIGIPEWFKEKFRSKEKK